MPSYSGAIFRRVKRFDSAAPPTRIGQSMPAARRSCAVDHHHLRRLHQQPGEADRRRAGAPGRPRTSSSGGTLMPRLMTLKPLLPRMMSTRFLPMSCTSPFTVASTMRALAPTLSALLHVRLEVRDRGLHRLGDLQHLGDDHLVGVEQAADLVHAGHQRAVDDLERRARPAAPRRGRRTSPSFVPSRM